MPSLTTGNRLYLYQLLRQRIGANRQTLIDRAEAAIVEDGIDPADTGFDDAREMLEALPEFVEVITFRHGNTYVIVHPVPEWDQLLERLATQPAAQTRAAQGRGRQQYRRGARELRPERPAARRRRQKAKAQAPAGDAAGAAREGAEATGAQATPSPSAGPSAQSPAAEAPAQVAASPSAPEPLPGALTPEGSPAPAPVAQAEGQPIAGVAASQPGDTSPQRPEPAARPQAPQASAPHDEPASTPVACPVAAPSATDAPAAAPGPTPAAASDDRGDAGARPAAASPAAGAPAAGERVIEQVLPAPLQWDLPERLPEDAHCTMGALLVLSRALPYDADLMRTLDEDWRAARSAGTFSGTHGVVEFPLRYLREDGRTHVTVTMERRAAAGTGRRWYVTRVDGDDGDAGLHEAGDFDGLALGDGGPWAALSPRGAGPLDDPSRALTQFAVIGTWADFLDDLARMAAPEPWDFPSEGSRGTDAVGGHEGTDQGAPDASAAPGASRRRPARAILRDYVCATFARVAEQGRLVTSPDGAACAFDTGLLSAAPSWRGVYCTFESRRGDPAWQFSGFTTELPASLARQGAPRPADYLAGLSDTLLGPDEPVEVDARAIFENCLGCMPVQLLAELLHDDAVATDLLARIEADRPVGQARDRAFALLSRVIATEGDELVARLEALLGDSVQTALRLARASYRVAAPAFDPRAHRVVLLLPLLVDGNDHAVGAVVLSPSPESRESGATRRAGYWAEAAVTLEQAYACARVVSAEMPAWLRDVVRS